RELRQLYAVAHRREPLHLPPPAPFAEHALRVAEEEREDGPAAAAAADYWSARFAGGIPPLDLPLDRPRARPPPAPAPPRSPALPAALGDGLRQLRAELGATPFMPSLAAYGALLHRLTGQEELVVAVPSRDPRAGVGYFINLLPLRLSAPAAPPGIDFAAYL